MSRITRIGLGALLVCAGACQPSPGTKSPAGSAGDSSPAGLSSADEAAVRAVDAAWQRAANAGDGAAIGAIYAADATILPPGDTARQGAAVAKYWSDMLAGATVSMTLATAHVQGSGDLAFATGAYHLAVTPKAAGAKPLPPEDGKYLEVMKKQPDGSWKIIYDIWNANTPPARPLA